MLLKFALRRAVFMHLWSVRTLGHMGLPLTHVLSEKPLGFQGQNGKVKPPSSTHIAAGPVPVTGCNSKLVVFERRVVGILGWSVLVGSRASPVSTGLHWGSGQRSPAPFPLQSPWSGTYQREKKIISPHFMTAGVPSLPAWIGKFFTFHLGLSGCSFSKNETSFLNSYYFSTKERHLFYKRDNWLRWIINQLS